MTRSNTSMERMFAEVKRLQGMDAVTVFPLLAELDRSAPGLFSTLLQGIFRTVFGLASVFVLSILVFILLPEAAWRIWKFAEAVNLAPPGEPSILSTGWVVILITAVGVHYKSEKFRYAVLVSEGLSSVDPALWTLKIALFPIRLIGSMLVIGIFLFSTVLALIPVWVTYRETLSIILYWLREPVAVRSIVHPIFDGPFAIVAWFFLLLLATVIIRIRTTAREDLVRLNLSVAGLLGVLQLGYITTLLNISSATILLTVGLFLIYPLNLHMRLGQLVKSAYGVYHNGWIDLVTKLRLRHYLGVVIREKEAINRDRTDGDGWASVCQLHRLRFVRHADKISYLRWINYSYCPACQDDHKAYKKVECVALCLDRNFTNDDHQLGSTVFFDGFQWLENNTLLPRTDIIILGQVDESDVEAFIAAYTNARKSPQYKSFNKLTIHLTEDCPINSESYAYRSLVATVPRVVTGYQYGSNSAPKGLRLKEFNYDHSASAALFGKNRIQVLMLVILLGFGFLIFNELNQNAYVSLFKSIPWLDHEDYESIQIGIRTLWKEFITLLE